MSKHYYHEQGMRLSKDGIIVITDFSDAIGISVEKYSNPVRVRMTTKECVRFIQMLKDAVDRQVSTNV